MAETTTKKSRKRSAHNLYLDSDVAEMASRIASKSKYKSLSRLTESLLEKYIINK